MKVEARGARRLARGGGARRDGGGPDPPPKILESARSPRPNYRILKRGRGGDKNEQTVRSFLIFHSDPRILHLDPHCAQEFRNAKRHGPSLIFNAYPQRIQLGSTWIRSLSYVFLHMFCEPAFCSHKESSTEMRKRRGPSSLLMWIRESFTWNRAVHKNAEMANGVDLRSFSVSTREGSNSRHACPHL